MAVEIECDECPVSAIINQYCSSSFETVSEPVIGPRGVCHRARVRATRCADPLAASSSDERNRARAGMRSNLLKHNNLMPASRLRRYRWRSEPTGPASGRPDDRLCERLEASAASDQPISHREHQTSFTVYDRDHPLGGSFLLRNSLLTWTMEAFADY